MAKTVEWPDESRDDWNEYAAQVVADRLNIRDEPEDIDALMQWLPRATAGHTKIIC